MRAVIVHKPEQDHEYEVHFSAGNEVPKRANDLVLDSLWLTREWAIHRAKELDDLGQPLYFSNAQKQRKDNENTKPSGETLAPI